MIFLDTGFLFAYVSENDEDHARVNEVLEEHRGRRLSDFLLTTNHVVAETITLVSKRGHRGPGIRHDLAVKVEKRGIREAWAVDEDFTHRFTARPGPRLK